MLNQGEIFLRLDKRDKWVEEDITSQHSIMGHYEVIVPIRSYFFNRKEIDGTITALRKALGDAALDIKVNKKEICVHCYIGFSDYVFSLKDIHSSKDQIEKDTWDLLSKVGI